MSQRNAGNPSKYPSKYNAAPAVASSPTQTAASSSSSASSDVNAFPTVLVAKIVAWTVGWYLCARIEFGSIYLIVSVIIGIFTNLSSDSSNGNNKHSAYSVFNRGATRIAGSMDAEAFENEIRHKPRTSKGIDLDIGDSIKKEHPERKSKAANQPCVCGSGKKYKNCCSPLTASEKQQEAEWQAYDKEWGTGR